MEILKKYLAEKFQEHLDTNFNDYCNRHGIAKNDHQLITYLIDQNLITASHLQRYTVLREFEKLSHEAPSPKTQAVETLASRFCLSERTVWSILKNNAIAKK